MKHVKLFEQFVNEAKNEQFVNEAKNSFKFNGNIDELEDMLSNDDHHIEGGDEDEDTYYIVDKDKSTVGVIYWDGKTVTLLDVPKGVFVNESVNEAAGLPSHARNLSRKLKAHWLPDTDKPWLPGADSKGIYFLADGPDRYQTNKGQTITIDLSVRTGEYTVIDKKDNVIYQGGDPYAVAKLIESKDDVIDETK